MEKEINNEINLIKNNYNSELIKLDDKNKIIEEKLIEEIKYGEWEFDNLKDISNELENFYNNVDLIEKKLNYLNI